MAPMGWEAEWQLLVGVFQKRTFTEGIRLQIRTPFRMSSTFDTENPLVQGDQTAYSLASI